MQLLMLTGFSSVCLQELRERIQPYFLRRLKSEVFREDDSENTKLSKKNEIIVWLRLTSCQVQEDILISRYF